MHFAARLAAAALMMLCVNSAARANVTFHFSYDTNYGAVTAEEQAALQTAANRWTSAIASNITINLQVGFQSLSAGTLGEATDRAVTEPYSVVRASLVSHATSPADATAFANLPATSTSIYINHTQTNYSSHFETAGSYNQNHVQLTDANAKALGFATTDGFDASIYFNSGANWDFDPSNGISAGQYDFVGAATHEIGHALGFLSEVDAVDSSPNQLDDAYVPYALDLFRHSAVAGNAIDLTADNHVEYFSLDGSSSKLDFSTGLTTDGFQASHWLHESSPETPLGIMDPKAVPGQLLAISSNDLLAFDAIGFTLTPEPTSLSLLVLGLGVCFWRMIPPRRNPS